MDGDQPKNLVVPEPIPLDGNEPIDDLPITIGDFWRWSASDLAENRTRGMFAEFLVARALGDQRQLRVEWDNFDVLTLDGVRVEVKSSAYLQRWHQERLSDIRFGGFTGQAWDPDTGTYAADRSVRADVFVFAIETCRDGKRYDPLDLGQWEFYVVPAQAIERSGQRSGGLSWVRSLAGGAVSWSGLADAVAEAVA